VIEDSPDEPGVYMVAGNRGVGKTNLVSKIINETSLQSHSNFSANLGYLFFILLTVVGTLFYFLKLNIPALVPWIITPIAAYFGSVLVVRGYRLFYKHEKNKWYEHKQKYNEGDSSKKGIFSRLKGSFVNTIKNYCKNRNRMYLRINFGHKLRDEKDILRLITRTLSTEYAKYRRSFWRMLPWWTAAFGVLFILAYLFSGIIKEQEFYKQCVENSILYKASSQVRLDNRIPSDWNFLHDSSFFKPKIFLFVNNNYTIRSEKILSRDGSFSSKVSSLLLALDRIIFEITKNVKTVPIDYLFWLSFLLMYLISVLIFRSTWITQFFVTHRITARRLRELNSNITYSTERENAIHIGENTGTGIKAKTKKSRGIADAREIEKELQDILNDMQHIPAIMCRPNIVIVFDELDKVEPGDTGAEKESPQTKASLFSIGATRDRQTEILKILSNMKYFLSTAHAKFIFIAGREMYDIYLADVSERNNYIGSIFNVVIYVPSFLTDHPTGKKSPREESSIASLPEEFVCRRLFPQDSSYPVESYDLKNYRVYLEKVIYKYDREKDEGRKKEIEQQIQKIIAVLQQFIIYLAHVSKGAPKKMTQLFESLVTVRDMDEKEENKSLVVQRYRNSRNFLTFSYYKQYTLGIIAYLMTPIFYRLSESNIKEHSDKLLVSTLRFADFLFKFHKHSFSWKHLEISPELMEVNRAPEQKSIAVELLNYLTQVYINKSNFSLYDYKFDSCIANEIFTMTKTDDVFSALFSFSLDEMLPLKQYYRELLEKNEREYLKEYQDKEVSIQYMDAVSSLQIVLGDLCYYDDELEEAGVYYKNAVEILRKEGKDGRMTSDRLYLYARNKLKIGMIHDKRRQYDFAYKTYSELCEQIILGRYNKNSVSLPWYFKTISPETYGIWSQKMTYEGLKMLYLPFLAKLQILEKSHVGGITRNHLDLLDKEFKFITSGIDHKEANLLEAEFLSRVADILYYKNYDLRDLNCKKDSKYSSCTACHYYSRALSTLLNINTSKLTDILSACVHGIKENFDMRCCTILARILSDWGNVFFSCDKKGRKDKKGNEKCYICDARDCNTENNIGIVFIKYFNYVLSNPNINNSDVLLERFKKITSLTKMEITVAMYSMSSRAYFMANQDKRSAYQMYKILYLSKYYGAYEKYYIDKLSQEAIHYLWHSSDDLNMFELNKRKKDFDKFDKNGDDGKISLQNLLMDSEITKMYVLIKELELKSKLTPETLRDYYGLRITSPYMINYSIEGRIYRLRLKSIMNDEAYRMLVNDSYITGELSEIENILAPGKCDNNAQTIFGKYFDFSNERKAKIEILDNLIAETIYCLTDIVRLSKTMGETYVFTHSFLGSIHDSLSTWIRRYKAYNGYMNDNFEEMGKFSQINRYLEEYLDEEWRELLSAYRENRQALSHYHNCIEMHNGGRAYHTMIDTLCYVKDDYNDRTDHFNIAEERHYMLNSDFKKKLGKLKVTYNEPELYKVDNYFEQDTKLTEKSN
jgi:hypothetical protein